MARRVLLCLLALTLFAGLGACSDDDNDGGAGGTTTQPGVDEETRENRNFCQELVEFATQVMAGFDASSTGAIAEWSEEVATQARELAANAPAAIRDTVEGYASAAEDAADDVAAGRSEAVAEVTNKINESFEKITTFAQENCRGVSVPPTTPAPR